ncbi:MAG: DUF6745 domain-containing protein, partial [Cyanobacteria bacterium J06598_1]
EHCISPVNLASLEKAVEEIYFALGKPLPKVTYCKGPHEAVTGLLEEEASNTFVLFDLVKQLEQELPKRIDLLGEKNPFSESEKWFSEIRRYNIGPKSQEPLYEKYHHFFSESFNKYRFFSSLVWIDYCTSVLSINSSTKIWSTLRDLAIHSDYVFFFDDYCYVSDRPATVRKNEKGVPHADGIPAVIYRDGFSRYFFNGKWVPYTYGHIPAKHWETDWLFHEKDRSLHQILVEGVGLERIKNELILEEKDSWKCYKYYLVENPKPLHQRFNLLVDNREDGKQNLIVVHSAPYERAAYELRAKFARFDGFS